MKLVTLEIPLGKLSDSMIEESWVVSPDSRNVACIVERGGKHLAILNGHIQKVYEAIGLGSGLCFSPDSKHVAYVAERAGKDFVVVDETQGEPYDAFVGDHIVFDNPSKLHTLAQRNREILRLELDIVP